MQPSRSRNFRISHGNNFSSFTVYVDNLPTSVGIPWFRKKNSNFGYVVDSHLPAKRSRRTGNRFGFIRFNRTNEVEVAISEANGLWVGKRYLLVERAKFDWDYDYPYNRSQISTLATNLRDFRNRYQEKHYAEPSFQKNNNPVLKENGKPLMNGDLLHSINVQPVASEWLTRSAVVKLFNITTADLVLKAFTDCNFNDVLVRHLGGMEMIITFHSKDERVLALNDPVVKSWFKSIKAWNGEVAGKSRLVWIKCRGMPLNAWCFQTFKRIGELWGDFITLDAETMKEETFDVGRMLIATESVKKIDDWINISVRGRNHRVKIWEEECEDFFNEEVIRDWVKCHLPVNKIQPKSVLNLNSQKKDEAKDLRNQQEDRDSMAAKVDDVDDDCEGDTNLFPNNDILTGVKRDEVVKGKENVPLSEESSRNEQNSKSADKRLETIREEEEESFVGETLNNEINNQVEGIEIAENSNHKNYPKEYWQASNELDQVGLNNQAPEKKVLTARQKRAKLRKEIRDICDSLDVGTQVGDVWEENSDHSDSIDSEDILRRNNVIIKGFEEAVKVSKRIGVVFHESDESVINRLAQRD